jgi:uncharacterized protein (DUF697 family)
LTRLLESLSYLAYDDTVRRLLKGSFSDLGLQARQARIEQIIRASAAAAAALAAAPVPLLELPVLMAMVQAIAKVHGVERPGRTIFLHLVAALGGGLALRQVLRLLPLAGSVSVVSRVYGAAWALGRAADLYFSRSGGPADPRELRRLFDRTLERTASEQEHRLAAIDFERRLADLRRLRERELISEGEYQAKRSALLALL